MRVLILGVGDAFTRRYFGSSAVVEGPTGLILIDCPDLIHRALLSASRKARWRIDAGDIHDIIITHLHGDHCNGLESMGFYQRILRQRDPAVPRPRLHVAAPVAERIWSRLAPAMDAPMFADRPSRLDDYFDVRVLHPGRVSRVAGLDVQCRFTKHPTPTIGLKLRDPRPASRVIFGWSSDTPYEQEHVDWLSEADLIVHESNRGPAHTPIAMLNALPADLRSRMRLIHLPDDFKPRSSPIARLREGQVLTIRAKRTRRTKRTRR